MLTTVAHVLTVFVAFALSAGVGMLVQMVAATRDVRAIRAVSNAARPLHIAGAILLLLGIVFGFVAAARHGFALSATWLVIAYALVVVLLILTGAFLVPWATRVQSAAANSPDDQPSPELLAAINSPARFAGPVTGLVWLAILVVMVLKP